MIELLNNAYKCKRVVSICKNKIDWEKRIVGVITSIDLLEEVIYLQELNYIGKKRKLRKIKIKSIYCLEFDDKYNKGIELILQTNFASQKKKKIRCITKSNVDIILSELLELGQITTFFFGIEYVTGFLSSFDDIFFKVFNITYGGEEDGISIYRKELLTKIETGTTKESKIELLYHKFYDIK